MIVGASMGPGFGKGKVVGRGRLEHFLHKGFMVEGNCGRKSLEGDIDPLGMSWEKGASVRKKGLVGKDPRLIIYVDDSKTRVPEKNEGRKSGGGRSKDKRRVSNGNKYNDDNFNFKGSNVGVEVIPINVTK